MSKDKFVKIPEHYRMIPQIGGIYGPINTPIKLASQTILELISLRIKVVECIKNYKTNEFVGEVELDLENYDKNNFNLLKTSETPETIVVEEEPKEVKKEVEIEEAASVEPLKEEVKEKKEAPKKNNKVDLKK